MSVIPQNDKAIKIIKEIVGNFLATKGEECTAEEKTNRLVFTLKNGKYFTVYYYDGDCLPTNQSTTSPEICAKYDQQMGWKYDTELIETIKEAYWLAYE